MLSMFKIIWTAFEKLYATFWIFIHYHLFLFFVLQYLKYHMKYHATMPTQLPLANAENPTSTFHREFFVCTFDVLF